MKANTILHSYSEYLTPSQIADLLGVTKRTIHTLTAPWITDGLACQFHHGE